MYCTQCGTSAESKRFCTKCGFELKHSAPQAATAESIFTIKTHIETQPDLQVDPLIGRTIDNRYFLESKLGGGGMGAVYRAKRLNIGDWAAVKILNSEHSSDSKAVERFYREAKVGASLRHPNAMMVYDFGVTEDKLVYFVMELIEGTDLRTIILQNGQIPQSNAADILFQVCAVLTEAHGKKVIHRDLKPENILVYPTPIGQRVKVLDFGVAALRDYSVDKLTKPGSVVGTPHYMSPEQLMGEEVDARSDIYSLGIILYEMLAGTVPFDSKTPTAIAVQHVNQAPPSLRELNPSVPPQVEAVVMRALKKRPEERPQTATALAEELLAAIHNHQTICIDENADTEKPPEVASARTKRSTRRGSAFALLAASLILLFVVASGFGPYRFFNNKGNGQQSISPVVPDNNQSAVPQLKAEQPTTPSPEPTIDKNAANLETALSAPVDEQPVTIKSVEPRKNAVSVRKPAPQKASQQKASQQKASPQKEVTEDRDDYRYNRDRRMTFDDYDRYRRYRPYGPIYRDRYYMRRRPRLYYYR